MSLKWDLHNECKIILDELLMVNIALHEGARTMLGQHGDLPGVQGETLNSLTGKARNHKKHPKSGNVTV